MQSPNTGSNRKLPPPAPTPQPRKATRSGNLSAEEAARILKQTEEAMAEETRKNEHLQKVQDASDEFLRIQKQAKQTNDEVSEHNEVMATRRRILLIVSASLIGLGILLKTIELTVMGGW